MNKICKRCNKVFKINDYESSRGRGIYCSKECMNKKVEVICKGCSKTFLTHPCRIKRNRGVYCSKECMIIYIKRKIIKPCVGCGTLIETYESRIRRRKGLYCSKACLYKYAPRKKTMPPETRLKMSLAARGKPKSIEHRKKISEFMKTRIGILNPAYGKKKSGKERLRLRNMNLLNQARIGNKRYCDTAIERKLAVLLNKYKIKYIQTYPLFDISHPYCCDFFVPKFKIVFEADGNHWHNYPYGRKIDNIRERELFDAGYSVIKFWESDINKNINFVEEKIKMISEELNNGRENN